MGHTQSLIQTEEPSTSNASSRSNFGINFEKKLHEIALLKL